MDPITAAAAEAKCRQFVEVINDIRDAGLYGPLVTDFVLDTDGAVWPIPPSQMNVADIFRFIEHRFGSLFLGFVKDRPDFTVH
jgi:hypothetical protein